LFYQICPYIWHGQFSSESLNAYRESTAINSKTTAVMLPNTKKIARTGHVKHAKNRRVSNSRKLLNNSEIIQPPVFPLPQPQISNPEKLFRIARAGIRAVVPSGEPPAGVFSIWRSLRAYRLLA